MASVSSLDQDMRKLRLDRYTPAAATEAREWIESAIGEPLSQGDLLSALKDGVALCKLANLVLPRPGIRFKASDMPFTQRENISHFLTACEQPPLNLPSHDRFLTVDLYESKDPAQVLQCLGAFSRAANAINPGRFPKVIGPKRAGGTSPTRRGANGSVDLSRERGFSNVSTPAGYGGHGRGFSPALTGGSDSSKQTSGAMRSPQGPVSSWSNKNDEGATAPAWNIHQYGYMGGASQGNQGVSFGGQRQIASPGLGVPSLQEKERLRKEQEQETERLRVQAEEAEKRRAAQRAAEEDRERIAEESRWEEETRKEREREKARVEEQKRQWAEEERRWKEAEEKRLQEEKAEEEARRNSTGPNLRGQYLSQYQSESKSASSKDDASQPESESERIRELERQLEQAKERERQYQLEREGRGSSQQSASPPPVQTTMSPPAPSFIQAPRNTSQSYRRPPSFSQEAPDSADSSLVEDDREYLQQQWAAQQHPPTSSRPLPDPTAFRAASRPSTEATPPAQPPRPLPPPEANTSATARAASPFTRPLPASLSSQQPQTPPAAPLQRPAGLGSGTISQGKTSSLLEREMERERERQREWEERQLKQGRVAGPREMRR